jgi:D-glycero-D-manno-heptose 1,7-bisphosphate phosphatase
MSPLVILDRDGVLNDLRVDPEHGTIDSPLHPSQVAISAGAPEAVALLTGAGYRLAIATNQPAAAKGKTTRANLEAVHHAVVERLQAAGGRIASSHICFHRAEDGCECRKPRPGLLKMALARHPDCDPATAWMIGDGLTDVEAGRRLGLRTVFLGLQRCDGCKIMAARELWPDAWSPSLLEWARATVDGSGRP